MQSAWDGEHEPPNLVFIVKDSGCGIPHDAQSVIFEKFQQARPDVKNTFGGTGLGLALSRKLAEVFGGTLRLLESHPGFGSSFELKIPVSLNKDLQLSFFPPTANFINPEEENELDDRNSDYVADLGKIRILLAEDVEDLQILTAELLEVHGATVDIANNGEDAIQMADSKDYDIVLMDLNMPVLDGYTAMERIKIKHPTLPIVALSANSDEAKRDKCLNGGFSDFILKPASEKDLLNCLNLWTS